MPIMDSECIQLLPAVCTVLADPLQPLSDDTCLEKLLDWFRSFTKQGSGDLLLLQNSCLTEFIQQVQKLNDPDPSLLSFTLRLIGMFASSERGFQHFLEGHFLTSFFGSELWTSDLWEDASVRSGWIRGVHSLAQHKGALQFLCDTGAVGKIFKLQGDPSLFVASAANQLLVHLLVSSVQLNMRNPVRMGEKEWPACAQMILAYLEMSLVSKTHSLVTQSLKSLTALFGGCHDVCIEEVWLHLAESVGSLLEERPVICEPALVDLLLSMARSPAFSQHDSTVWPLVTHAMERFSPLQAGPLALGVLKLSDCPKVVYIRSLSVLLQPLDYVLRATASHLEYRGMLDELVCDPASVETLLSIKSSCVTLICHALAHLQELHRLPSLPEEWSHAPLLNAVVVILQFCIGTSTVSSTAGVKISQLLMGSSRVQGLAVDTLSSFSCSKIQNEWLPKIFALLLVYIESPDTSPTVLKKCFQAALKWLQDSSETENVTGKWPHCEQFLVDLYPVLQKRLCSPGWEVRDSALEFITQLSVHLSMHGFAQNQLFENVKELVWDLLKDPVSYVRASAVSTMGQLTLITTSSDALPGTESSINEEADIVSEFLEILSKDTEGFPRRAVVNVFTDWLRQGHLEKLGDAELLVSSILQIVNNDLDWEVKVNGLELAEIFIEKTLGRSSLSECPSAAELSSRSSHLKQSLEKMCRVKLFLFLFSALCDCDRPVAQKSCRILIDLGGQYNGIVLEDKGTTSSQKHGTDWLEDAVKKWQLNATFEQENHVGNTSSQELNWTLDTLRTIDLESLQVILEQSSDHIENSPLSLLQDILATAGTFDENGIDCY